MPDFREESFTSNNWLGKVTPTIIFAQFEYFKALMTWMKTAGLVLLQCPHPIAYEDWVSLEENAQRLYRIFGNRQRTIAVLHTMVFKRGVESLLQLVQADPQASDYNRPGYQRYCQWFYYLYQMTRPEGTLGVGSHYCRIEESRELIESLVPIARCFKEHSMMDCIAYNRFPADANAIQMFKEKHPDVPSTPNHPY